MIAFPKCQCSNPVEAVSCKKECEYQDYLVHEGIIISCDSCGDAGHTDSDGWEGVVNSDGQCAVYCLGCWGKIEKQFNKSIT